MNKPPLTPRDFLLAKIIETREVANGSWFLKYPDDSLFYTAYSKYQILADGSGWTYWKGIQQFPVRLTVEELSSMLEQYAALAIESHIQESGHE